MSGTKDAAWHAARELKQALAANAYPAADGTADIDNDATELIAITLRSFAESQAASIRSAVEQEISEWLRSDASRDLSVIRPVSEWKTIIAKFDRDVIADAIASGAYRRKKDG